MRPISSPFGRDTIRQIRSGSGSCRSRHIGSLTVTTRVCAIPSRPTSSSLSTLSIRPRPNRANSVRILASPIVSQIRSLSSTTAAPSAEPLPRSIGPSTALLLITLPIPPSAWPSKLEFASPLLSLASRSLKSRGVVVNAIWDGSSSSTFEPTTEEVYPARLFWPDGTTNTFRRFSASSLVSPDFQALLSTQMNRVDRQAALSVSGKKEQVEIVVCTHGSRDCRCGDKGGALVDALKEEIGRRGLEGKVKVGEVAHVGGHKYAANAIILPSLDLLGNLLPSHATHLISWALQGRPGSDDMWQHWRGRYGLTEVEQAGVWGGTGWAHREEKEGEEESKTVGKGGAGSTGKDKQEGTVVGKEVDLRFKTYEGEIREVKGKIGETLLELGKREGLPSIEGVCGGKLECATCHIYLPAFAPVQSPSDAEEDMLGYALGYREGESRLGCQIRVSEDIARWVEAEGGVIGLPRY